MKKTVGILLLSIVLAAFAGCTSARVSTEGNLNMITASNEGLFLFHAIPICSGDPEYPNEQVANWWTNTVNVKTNVKLLEEEAARQGAFGMKNIVTRLEKENILWMLLQRKTCRSSAELLK